MLETRHGLLRTIALISKGLGVVFLILGVISLLAGLTVGGNMPAFVPILAKVAGLLILITGAFFFVILYAIGDMVLVLLGIESNTQELRQQITSAAAAAAKSSMSPTRPLGSPATRASASSTLDAARERAADAASSAPQQKKAASPEQKEDPAKRAAEQARRAAEIAQKGKGQKP
jgi:hypothetical protein